MKNIIFVGVLIFSFMNAIAQVKDSKLVLTRTIAQLANQDNKLLISVSEDGYIDIKYPLYHKLYGKNNHFNNSFSQKQSENIFNTLDFNWSTENIQSQLEAMKTNSAGQLYYNSEPDLLQLSYFENNKVIWQIAIPDYLALKHFNRSMGKLDKLVSLIDSMQDISTQHILKTKKELVQ